MSRPCVATAEKNMIAFDKRKKVIIFHCASACHLLYFITLGLKLSMHKNSWEKYQPTLQRNHAFYWGHK